MDEDTHDDTPLHTCEQDDTLMCGDVHCSLPFFWLLCAFFHLIDIDIGLVILSRFLSKW